MELTLDQALQQAVAAHREGKLQDAERFYLAILQTQPNNPDANHNLGLLAVAVGKPLDAVPFFKLALEASPQIEQFWLSYIDVLIALERFDDAERVVVEGEKAGVSSEKLAPLHQQIRKSPPEKKKNTRQGLSVSEKRKKLANKKGGLHNKGQTTSSGAAISQGQINHLLGHYQASRLEEAEELATSLTQQFPKEPFGWKVLGAIYNQTSRQEEALIACQKSVELSPHDAEAHNNLGNTLKALGRLDESEASHRQAIVLKPDNAEAHYNLGNTLKALGRLEESEARHRQAIALKPDFAQAHRNLGVTLQQLGRLDEAEASYRQAIILKPNYVEAHRHLAAIKKFSSRDEQFLQMQELYKGPAISEQDRCHICFALAKAYEDLGEFARAFQLYAEGGALRKKQLGYHKVQDQKLFEKLKASFPRIAAHTLQPEIVAAEPSPIFIVGLPRSGTSLVEQIISSHPLVAGAGELPFVFQYGGPLAAGKIPVDAQALTTFREKYVGALQQRAEGKAIVTDKMPQNFRFLGLIAAALPEAKIIHVKRDPAAVCWANYTQYFVSEAIEYCYSLDDILHYHRLYEDLMSFCNQALPNRIYDLRYELLTENQEVETRSLIGHLGLEWDDACLLPEQNKRVVETASNVQVRQTVYQGSSEKWKRYRPFLDGVLDQLSAGGN